MTDWNALTPGSIEQLDDNGAAVLVEHPKDGVFVIRRHFDGSWQDTVWVRQIGVGWGVSRELGAMGTIANDLVSAIEVGIVRSREALKQP